MARIILYCNDTIGQQMAGPGIRYVQIARALSKKNQVLLVAPKPSDFQDDSFQFKAYRRPREIIRLLKKHQIILAQKLPTVLIKACRHYRVKFIADCYDPVVLENLEANRGLSMKKQVAIYEFEQAGQALQLAAADHILVASKRQRDFYLGILISMGRIVPEVYNEDVSLDQLISLLPFGVERRVPKMSSSQSIKKLVPNYSSKDKIVLWGGGIWNWFDPLSVIEAIHKLRVSHPEIKLLFLGTRHPNKDMPEMAMTAKAMELAGEMKLTGKRVFFNQDWIPYAERANYVLPCWVGISTHFDHVETRLSFRTRIVDSYIWANLPIVATKGDSMADMIEDYQLGLTADYLSSDEIAEALKKLAEDTDFYQQCQSNVEKIRQEFEWPTLVSRLDKFIEENRWTRVIVDNNSLQLLSAAYWRAGFFKLLRTKGWKGIFNKLVKIIRLKS